MGGILESGARVYRIGLALLASAWLAACAPPVPDARQTGVGFGTPGDVLSLSQGGTPALAGPFVPAGRISDEQAQAGQATAATAAATDAPTAPLRAVSTNNPGISDEQDFSAVSARESIESDRERLAAQREAFQIIQPGALPTRPGGNEPSIVQFALATNHARGAAVYSRPSLGAGARFDRNCAKYASSDQAQIAFLKAGGPERDRYGIDPDGDGYACYWDPTPFRAAVNR